MARRYLYAKVQGSARSTIYAVRVQDEILDLDEIDQLAARMREKVEARGEFAADVVVVQGGSKETLALYGVPYSVARVRTAMFNAAIRWMPIAFD
jgi:hypothetical protein